MMWSFCLQSLFREYGWQFFRRMALPHPARTTRAFMQSGRIDIPGEMIGTPGDFLPGSKAVVGAGFCMKPIDPPCPAGRANHECLYFERSAFPGSPVCESCLIREFGMLALQAGSAFYIMTSARDILLDIFEPSLRQRQFTSGLFVLCSYSIRPFAVGLLASGIRGCLFPFNRGDCRDYGTWLQADRGIKNEQTEVLDSTRFLIRNILQKASKDPTPAVRFHKQNNIYFSKEFHPQ